MRKIVNRQQAVVICGSVFIVIGLIVIFGWAYQPLLEVNQWIQNPTCDDLLLCKKTPFGYLKTDENQKQILMLIGEAKFSSRGFFAVNNQFDYEINLKTENPNSIKTVYFVIGHDNDDFSYLNNLSAEKFLNDAKVQQNLIDMQKTSENEYYRKGTWTSSSPSKIVLVGIIVDANDNWILQEKTDPLVSITTEEEKSQDNANLESRITNKIILGLTWMGIGLAPILLGADFIVRVVLKE